MFQTKLIIDLQALGNQTTQCFAHQFMILITKMGYPSLIVPIIIIAIFGINFKKGFLLLQIFMWTELLTDILKLLFGYPRPYYMDNRVLNLENCTNITSTSNFTGNEAKGFLALPSDDILTALHSTHYDLASLGFPSGHVSLTTALWGGTAIIFNNQLIKRLTPFAMVLMAFSRIYLGKHFIGDVFGGAVVGLISLVVFAYFLKSPLKDDFFKKESFEFALRYPNLFFYCFMFVIPIFLVALSLAHYNPLNFESVGYFFGMNVAYIFTIRTGIPVDTRTAEQRITRAFIALLLFMVSKNILEFLFCATGKINCPEINCHGFILMDFLKTFIPLFTIWVSVVICTKLNLYRKNEGSL